MENSTNILREEAILAHIKEVRMRAWAEKREIRRAEECYHIVDPLCRVKVKQTKENQIFADVTKEKKIKLA